MRSFHDVIRDLLDRLRHTPSSQRFLPRTELQLEPDPVPPIRHLYRTEMASWGQDGGYDPSKTPLPSGFETVIMPVPATRPGADRRQTINTFRLFDD